MQLGRTSKRTPILIAASALVLVVLAFALTRSIPEATRSPQEIAIPTNRILP